MSITAARFRKGCNSFFCIHLPPVFGVCLRNFRAYKAAGNRTAIIYRNYHKIDATLRVDCLATPAAVKRVAGDARLGLRLNPRGLEKAFTARKMLCTNVQERITSFLKVSIICLL